MITVKNSEKAPGNALGVDEGSPLRELPAVRTPRSLFRSAAWGRT
jgi:hypothetical protein